MLIPGDVRLAVNLVDPNKNLGDSRSMMRETPFEDFNADTVVGLDVELDNRFDGSIIFDLTLGNYGRAVVRRNLKHFGVFVIGNTPCNGDTGDDRLMYLCEVNIHKRYSVKATVLFGKKIADIPVVPVI